MPLKFDGVFEGGGVKGIGLVGALAYLEDQGYEPVNLAGTSAGAIVAALRAAGYSGHDLKQTLMGMDLRKFTDPTIVGRLPVAGPIISLMRRLGIYKGDYFLGLIRELPRGNAPSEISSFPSTRATSAIGTACGSWLRISRAAGCSSSPRTSRPMG
jgi:predicted acylesterase/phospholipase RssA